MTTDKTPATLAVDVLAVMDESIRRAEERGNIERSDRLRAARAAVAELIQIAMEFSDYVAVDHNDTSLLDREDMWDRLGSAISRVKGESA